jgi:CheY-like chemotaxis protein
MNETAPAVGYLLCSDLMWLSRITGTARDLGLKVMAARSLEQLAKLVQQQLPVCVFLDLDMAPADQVISQVRALGGTTTRFVAFGSHVAVDVLAAARAAGCDLVLPRSKMAELLPTQLPVWLTPLQAG